MSSKTHTKAIKENHHNHKTLPKNGSLMNTTLRCTTFAALVMSLILLSGCATMNQDECSLADWRAVGYEQGSKGANANSFERYRKDCAKYQIKADFDRFVEGHREGLKSYCTFDGGKALGERGKPYNTVCSRQTFPDFEEGHRAGIYRYCSFDNGYSAGKQGNEPNALCPLSTFPSYAKGHAHGIERFTLEKDIRDVESDLEDIAEELSAAQLDVDNAEAILVSETSTSLARKQALEDLDSFKREYRKLDGEYHALENKLERLRARLAES